MKLQKEDIYLVGRHGNLSEKHIEKLLDENVYADKYAWQQFLKLFLFSLGVGFTAAGIVFFFAYNWADIHKFIKLGIIEIAILLLTGIILYSKASALTKNIILTGLSIVVGVMFAVFGQVYQTGANAYDFFLGWTLCILLWVIVSSFAPLWLLFLTLVNTTFILYSNQVANGWSFIFVTGCLFYFNTMVLLASMIIAYKKPALRMPKWFQNVLSLACIAFSTISIVVGVFEEFQVVWLITLLIAGAVYTAGIMYGLKLKSGFYLAITSFSTIIIISAFLIDMTDDEPIGVFLLVSVFIIVSVTLVIKGLLNLQKKWSHEITG